MIYIKVSVPILLFKTFIYSYNKSKNNLFIGQGVQVPFNNRKVSGFIIDVSQKTSFPGKIKPIISFNNNSIPISIELLRTINWMSKYYITPIGKTLKSTISYQLFEGTLKQNKQIKISKLGKDKLHSIKFPQQKNILKYLESAGRYIAIEDLQFISISYRQICKKLYEKKLVDINSVIYEEKSSKRNKPKKEKIKLNKEQSHIYSDLIKKVLEGCKQFILSGVPGSGKTILYSKVVDKIIE